MIYKALLALTVLLIAGTADAGSRRGRRATRTSNSTATLGTDCNPSVDSFGCDNNNFLVCDPAQSTWLRQNDCGSTCLDIPSYRVYCFENAKSRSQSATPTIGGNCNRDNTFVCTGSEYLQCANREHLDLSKQMQLHRQSLGIMVHDSLPPSDARPTIPSPYQPFCKPVTESDQSARAGANDREA
ncbi:hypothetical protein HK097_008339 [Rhizophlyctis rosea]|uniref:Uncharacterized protein n=1 Tax=Rhizophlyctis rosea TaxID=64517 RepID=A0AAD5SCH2_9FUNG|nr:hypothetical protein HK097_008339 [Rhizophlyctis rosea]